MEQHLGELLLLVKGSNIKVYYTLDDLDMNGDGDADDEDDLNEATLCLYHFDEDSGTWVKVAARAWPSTGTR